MENALYQPPDPLGRLGVRVRREVTPQRVVWEFRGSHIRRVALGLVVAGIAYGLLRGGAASSGSPQGVLWFIIAFGAWTALFAPRRRVTITPAGWEFATSFHPLGAPVAIVKWRAQSKAARFETRLRGRRSIIELIARLDRGTRVVGEFPLWYTLTMRELTRDAVEKLAAEIERDGRRVGARTER
jgi:hypothetical protein